jgi:hypothetical protein
MFASKRHLSQAFACFLAASVGIAAAAPAQSDVLTVTAKGTIAPTCSLSATQPFAAASFNASGSSAATANVNCNQLFKVTATSANGAIKSSVPASAPFTNALPYMLKADVRLDDGSVTTATCASSALVAGQSSCPLSPANSTGLTSNGKIATDKTTTLTVSWTPPSLPTVLKPGSYSDTITLTIASLP